MNYIKLINAFYDRLETNSLSSSAIALWHALVHICNKTAWQREFSVAASVLCAKTGLSERTISNARNELKQKGYIDFRSRGGNKSPIYILKDLSESLSANISDNLSNKESLSAINADSVSDNVSDIPSDSVSGNPSILNKLNKTKQNETISATANNRRVNCFDEYHICFGRQPSPIQLQEIISFIEKDGISEEAVCVAFRKAAEIGASYSYARKILNSWAQKSIRTLADVEKEQKNFEQRKKQASSKLSVIRQEKLPEWFYESENNSTDNDMTDEQLQIKKRRIEEKLKKYREAKEG